MWFILLLCIIAAFADVIGGALTIFKKLSQKEILIVTGLGSGFLLGATLLDRLPESIHELPNTAALYIVIGYLALLLIGQYTAHHHIDSIDHPSTDGVELAKPLINSKTALISFIGLLFHTFMDGVIIAGAFTLNSQTGFLIFLAIAMHKIPEGFSMATISLSAGTSRRRALLTSTGLAVSTLIGASLTLLIGDLSGQIVKILMALATGTFLYVSTTDMIPAIKDKQRSAVISVLIGVFVFYVSLQFITHFGLG